jgi:hypothetical protein
MNFICKSRADKSTLGEPRTYFLGSATVETITKVICPVEKLLVAALRKVCAVCRPMGCRIDPEDPAAHTAIGECITGLPNPQPILHFCQQRCTGSGYKRSDYEGAKRRSRGHSGPPHCQMWTLSWLELSLSLESGLEPSSGFSRASSYICWR